jgi:hypothetical protein
MTPAVALLDRELDPRDLVRLTSARLGTYASV